MLKRRIAESALSGHVADASESVPGCPESDIAAIGVDENHEYSQIIEILKQCDANRWNEFLENFENEMITDKAMEYMKCDPDDDDPEIWKQLMPPFGVRVMFKTLWNERYPKENDEVIRSATTMNEGPNLDRAETAASAEGAGNTGDTNTPKEEAIGDI